MSSTPETDAAAQAHIDRFARYAGTTASVHAVMPNEACVPVELARRLERERDEARADVERLRADAERLDWLTRMVSGNALRWIGVEWFVWSPENARAAIDAALADQEGGR